MPAQPAWFHRLAKILDTLRTTESTHLDRRAGEKLFRVRQRRVRWPGHDQPPWRLPATQAREAHGW